MNRNTPIQDCLNDNLSGLYITRQQHRQLMDNITGGTKMKKKLTTSLALAIILTLLAMTALAALVLTRSPQADIHNRARAALSAKYGLTPDSLGTFNLHDSREGDSWTVLFTSASFHPSLVGEYRVTLDKDQVIATWSHDAADKAVWEKAGLDSPVWGQPQIAQALRSPDEADRINMALYRESPVPANPNMPDPEVLKGRGEDESYWNGEIVKAGAPGQDDLSREQALQIAHQAIMEDFGLSQAELDAGQIISERFYLREGGGSLWGFSIAVEKDGLLWDCGVTMDGQTGEILLSNIITGGNG